LAALFRETADLLGASLPRNIQLRLEVSPNLPPVQGDATLLEQVLMNLCMNARDAMPSGGTLTLSAASESDGVKLCVSDTGVGMSDEVKKRLFEPFFTTKAPGRGTGLGLSMVQGIVRSHGGRLEAESSPGRGSRFVIHLPSGAPTAAETSPPAAPAPLSSGTPAETAECRGSETVLFIDDERMLLETSQSLLAAFGYRVFTAEGGVPALRLLEDPAFNPEVILLDVVMPGLSGLPLLHELRRRRPKASLILVTAYAQEGLTQQMLRAGAQALVRKPFLIRELAAVIRSVVAAAKKSAV
jgi:hypothetical protein